MRYWLATLAGLALAGLAIVATAWGVYHLGRTSTCASGGPYLSAHPCPKGTGGHILALTGGIFGLILGMILYALRGEERPGLPVVPFAGTVALGLATAAGIFSWLGPARGDAGGAGAFMAVVFAPMAIAALVTTLRAGAGSSPAAPIAGTRIQPSALLAPPPGPMRAFALPAFASPAEPPAPEAGDQLARLERLADLHAKGVLTDAEFEAQKQRILAGG